MTGNKEVQILRMTLDELINAMEPQARKDKALISKCVDGLTEYAAELRQKAGDAGKEQISALRRLVDELAGYRTYQPLRPLSGIHRQPDLCPDDCPQGDGGN